MTIATEIRRLLGTMIVHGFFPGDTQGDLEIARKLGAEVVEILPNWKADPDPHVLKSLIADQGMVVHSVHGCWGGRSIQADRVDLGSTDQSTWLASLDDLKRCIEWTRSLGGKCLVIHPGGFSAPEATEARRDSLIAGLIALADHSRDMGLVVCVENMPPGVYPGSRMIDLYGLVSTINRPEIALALDTGHAHISGEASGETRAAGIWLKTTHVHDNNGRQDAHLPPGLGSVDWGGWIRVLDEIGYRGPILLECIRYLREHPESLDQTFLTRLRRLSGSER